MKLVPAIAVFWNYKSKSVSTNFTQSWSINSIQSLRPGSSVGSLSNCRLMLINKKSLLWCRQDTWKQNAYRSIATLLRDIIWMI